MKRLLAVVVCVFLAACFHLAAPLKAEEQFERFEGRDISELAYRSPFAYYPSFNKLKMAVQVPFMQLVPAECLIPAPGAGDAKNGLRADYYAGADFDNPVVSRIDPVVHFDWGGGYVWNTRDDMGPAGSGRGPATSSATCESALSNAAYSGAPTAIEAGSLTRAWRRLPCAVTAIAW